MSNDPNQTGQQGQDPSEEPVQQPNESDQDFQRRQQDWQKRQGQAS